MDQTLHQATAPLGQRVFLERNNPRHFRHGTSSHFCPTVLKPEKMLVISHGDFPSRFSQVQGRSIFHLGELRGRKLMKVEDVKKNFQLVNYKISRDVFLKIGW